MIIAPLRGSDRHGSGAYLASRGGRKHNGIDLACPVDSIVLSDHGGVVSRLGWPYTPTNTKNGHLRYVQVSIEGGFHLRYFYVNPCVIVGQVISKYDKIGITQGLLLIYPGITDHYHFEVKDGQGKFIDPVKFLEELS